MTSVLGAEELTRTELLGGRVICLQPAQGFRVAIDAVLLAAAVPAGPGATVLDVGTGTGAAALCVAARVADVSVVGLDIQDHLVPVAHENAVLSGLAGRVRMVAGDLLAPPDEVPAASFDHVIANPPYMKAGAGQVPADPGKAMATIEGRATLADWLHFCAQRAKPGGTVTVVHRHDRLDEVLTGLNPIMGPLTVLPLLPKVDAAPKRVLVQALRGGEPAVRYMAGLVLHEAGRQYTAAAESVLRDAAPLLLSGDDDLV